MSHDARVLPSWGEKGVPAVQGILGDLQTRLARARAPPGWSSRHRCWLAGRLVGGCCVSETCMPRAYEPCNGRMQVWAASQRRRVSR